MFAALIDAFGRFSFGKVFALLWILGGVYGVADAVYDQQRGIAEAITPVRGGGVEIAIESQDPVAFRNLIAYQWVRAAGELVVGFAILAALKRQNRLDPFSPDFAGAKEIDELEQTLKRRDPR